MERILEIPNTLVVLMESWRAAEEKLRYNIATVYPGVGEEFITQMFHGQYGAELSYASQCKHIEDAFLEDLKIAFPSLTQELHQISSGLIAEVTLHKRSTEKITGGDIGILIIRPNIFEQGDYLRIIDYRRGLLCQAKLKNRKGQWGSFTERQMQVLPERLSYLALLLYSYSDKARRSLNPFLWQLCKVAELSEVQNWMRNDNFPELVTSDHIIAPLGSGKIGVDNDCIIDSVISPSRNPTLVIRVTWPDDQRPGGSGSEVRIYSRQENQVKQQIRIRH